MVKPSLAPTASWLYDLVLRIFAPLLDLFFREIQVRGAWRIPPSGAVILVAAPHANQFVDSLVLMRTMRSQNRRVSWLMAAKSFAHPIIGPLANMIGAVPVSRAMDITKPGKGSVFLDIGADSCLLRGTGTDFKAKEFEVGGSIYLPSSDGESYKLDIAEIRSSTEITLKNTPNEEALVLLAGPVGTSFKVAPHVDQTAVYNAVFERLNKEGCIGIFPEGGSHDRPNLLPLKAGIAIIALGALAQDTKLTVVPVGLNYFHAHKFRSRAVVEFGDPVSISPELVEKYKLGKKRESVGTLLGAIFQSLAAVTMTAPDFETLMLVHAARRLYFSQRRQIPLSTVIEVNRRLLKGYTQHKDSSELQSLSTRINQYDQQLKLLGLRDRQVAYARFSTLQILSTLLYRTAKLILLSVATIPGLVLFSPVFIVARTYSHKKTKEALAGSTVKIRGNDVMATWKILVACGLAPLLYTYYALILAFWTHYNHINNVLHDSISPWTVVLTAYIVFPVLTFAALRFGEIGLDILKSLRPLVLCLMPSSAGTLAQLRDERVKLSQEVIEVVNTLGPDLFPDCDAAKLPMPRKLYSEISPEMSLDDLADSEFFS